MTITMVGSSEGEYYVKGERTAYITLNSKSVFRIYESNDHGSYMVAEYKTYNGAKKYLKNKGFSER